MPSISLVQTPLEDGLPMGNKASTVVHQRIPSSVRYKQRESTYTLPKQPKPEHNEIERRFNQVLVSNPTLPSSFLLVL